ncbi:MAG TPA: hypothetical protein VNI01_03900 [Elusimicrobiota bacterium]|jgi:hypothetical protein|nr:hypothetical protein [Elusimicrobiota bacterium]
MKLSTLLVLLLALPRLSSGEDKSELRDSPGPQAAVQPASPARLPRAQIPHLLIPHRSRTARALQDGGRGAPSLPDQILMVELRMDAFRGEDPNGTRAAVDGFFGSHGWRIRAYQDNEALDAFEFRRGGRGGSLLRRVFGPSAADSIARLPGVRSVRQMSSESWTALLERPAYAGDLAKRWHGQLPSGLVPGFAPGRSGVWVILSIEDHGDPDQAALKLRRSFPGKVAWAEAGISSRPGQRIKSSESSKSSTIGTPSEI